MELVIAEKPSVAQSIAAVLGATQRKDGYLEGNEYLVSWCVGHLVELAQPESYEEAWKKWSYESLPIIPQEWQHEVKSDTKAQYQILKKLMHDDRVDAVVCATDAGREGELMQQYEYYLLRKPLHYILQYGCGRTAKADIIQRQRIILELFDSYWNENVWNVDYEPYSAIEGGGLRDYLMLTAAKRYILLYDADFKVRSLRWTELLICFSKIGATQIRTMIPTDNDGFYEQALEDCIYKPLGNGNYPKASLADAPIVRTKDGCMFGNPFLLLFNNSVDTQFLNYLRRHDNKRFLKIKDKIKERCIPEVESWMDRRLKKVKRIANFELKIPGTKNKRELDLLISDSIGNALYIEFKHFYLPESYSEKRNLDSELRKAQKKMKDQLYAIKENSEEVMYLLKSNCKINRINGLIVSYLYTGTDVCVSDEYPIVSLLTVKEAIENAESVKAIYDFCQKSEKKYANIPLVTKNVIMEYANMKWELPKKVFDPIFEKKANEYIYGQVVKEIDAGIALKRVRYKELNLNSIIKNANDM